MKLVLVAIHLEPSSRALPLGPAMLASALKRAFPEELQTTILDLFLDQPAAACVERILALEPDWVGFSIYVWNRQQSLEIARLLQARRPGLVLFAGGAEATADPAGVLAEGALAFLLPGEGEGSILTAVAQLLEGVTPQGILAAAPPPDLAALASPYLDGTLNLRSYRGALWELSRGCPFTCDFCFESRGTDGIRRMPMERVAAELAAFRAGGIREVFVLDPTFNFHRPQAKQILRLLAEEAPDIHFFFEVRSEFLDREMAGLFAALRCTLQIGLQSAHDAVLRNVGRRVDLESFEAKLLLLHKAGVPYGFDLIMGLPGDSLAGFRSSVDFALSLRPNHLDIFQLSVLPGTRLAGTASALGLEHEAAEPYHVLASPTFSREDMALAARIAQGCEVFYNRGRAVPWFDLILEGLGLPASELFEAFAGFLEGPHAEDPILAQRDFIVALFEAQDDGLLGGLAADIISYFGYAGELLEGFEPFPRGVVFGHDPLALLAQLQEGAPRLEELVFSLPPHPCEALLSLLEGEVVLQLLPEV